MPSTRFLPVASAIFLATASGLACEEPEPRFANMSPDEVAAFEKKVLRKVADLALIPPVLNTSPLTEYDYDQLDFAMNIGIARTPGGRLWAAWIAGYDGPAAFLVAATSDDDGETWSKPRLIIDSHSPALPMDRSVIVGNLWTDPRGRLWIFFDQSMHHFHHRTTDAEIYLARFTEEDVLARELTGPRSRLKILVSRATKGKENASPSP